MIRIVADDKIPFLQGILEPYAEIQYVPGKSIDREIVEHADAILIRTRTRCDEKLLQGTPVRFIATATIGHDHIDTSFCEKTGINWVNAPGCNASSVLQYMASALFNMAEAYAFRLKGLTLGIIGAGHVGSMVERFGGLLGMKVLVNDPPRERVEGPGHFVPLGKVLNESDIITLHVPLTESGPDKTLQLIGKDTADRIKPGAWLINTSRGEVVYSSFLKEALKEKRLTGAVLDVWENEPFIDPELLPSTFIATPHIAGYSLDGKAMGTAMVVRALSQHYDLPLFNWYPEEMTEPVNPLIRVDTRDKTSEEIIRNAAFQTYRIREDDTRFRNDPSGFEQQRENYPARREFHAYKVELSGENTEASYILSQLGFALF